jgi:sugar/nucleoside kinase (ribokinase family)
MSKATLGLVAVGNALVDVLAKVEESFIDGQAKYGMQKGAMTLIDEPRGVELYSLMPPAVETSGGSAANTMAGFASFGGKGGFIGKVASDDLGKIFKHDMTSQGLVFETTPLAMGAPTGRCLIMVSPDGQRTMNTFLGAAVEMGSDDIDEDIITSAAITYLEGYLFDRDQAKQAFYRAAEIAHNAGRKVSLTLSDPFCVERHRADFLALVEKHVDILFANEHEIMSLYQTENFDAAIAKVSSNVEVAVVTRGKDGAVVVSNGQTIAIKAQPVDEVVDTTGAGDAFAAGFLYGYSEGMDLAMCGKLGAMAAAEVIAHIGPRPQASFSTFLKEAA